MIVNSYGRRRRRDVVGHSRQIYGNNRKQEDFVVIESLHVSDKFGFNHEYARANEQEDLERRSGTNGKIAS